MFDSRGGVTLPSLNGGDRIGVATFELLEVTGEPRKVKAEDRHAPAFRPARQ